MRIVVQKFGGTSVHTAESRAQVVRRVLQAKEYGLLPAVVVSAMGRNGDPYATDTLIHLAEDESGAMSAREMDLLLSCGEIISATILAQNLQAIGHPAAAFTGNQAGIITNNRFGNARIVEVRPDRINQALQHGIIPVVTGFQGITQDGDVTTLGRGGSDTTAAALGVALKAEVVEIFTDVEGVKTADPRLVPDAPTLETISYREVVELAHLGAKVIHPRAVEIAMEGRVPLKIRSTHSDAPGTLICDGDPKQGMEGVSRDRIVRGIAHIPNVAHVRIRAQKDFNESNLGLEIFERVAAAGVSVDLIYVSPEMIAFIIPAERSRKVEAALSSLELEVEIRTGFAKVSAVGAGMHGVPGVMARVARALSEGGVPIYQTGDSHANISCLIRSEDVQKAVVALHRQFHLSKDEKAKQSSGREPVHELVR